MTGNDISDVVETPSGSNLAKLAGLAVMAGSIIISAAPIANQFYMEDTKYKPPGNLY